MWAQSHGLHSASGWLRVGCALAAECRRNATMRARHVIARSCALRADVVLGARSVATSRHVCVAAGFVWRRTLRSRMHARHETISQLDIYIYIGAQRRPATMPRRYPVSAYNVFFVGVSSVFWCGCRVLCCVLEVFRFFLLRGYPLSGTTWDQ